VLHRTLPCFPRLPTPFNQRIVVSVTIPMVTSPTIGEPERADSPPPLWFASLIEIRVDFQNAKPSEFVIR
jgi:hypothetical protein